jgi:GNAT superfamily N-acetyltransferase
MKIYLSEDLELDTAIERFPINEIYDFLKTSYWASQRSIEDVEKSMRNSLCFGLYLNNKLIGFARVVTDYTVLAYLCDVFILPQYQSKGFGSLFVHEIMNHPELHTIRRWLLATKDAHELYRKFGFKELESPLRWMEIFRADL